VAVGGRVCESSRVSLTTCGCAYVFTLDDLLQCVCVYCKDADEKKETRD
jgi:hypothetical protein